MTSAGHGAKWSRLREVALAALLGHASIKGAAKSCGIAEVTLRRWLRNPEFAAQYQEARSRTLEHATAQVKRSSLRAVVALQRIIEDRKSSPASVVAAARTVLECAGVLHGTSVVVNVPQNVEDLDRKLREILDEVEARQKEAIN